MSRTAVITVTVDLDDDNLPVDLRWEATDAQGEGPSGCDAMMLSFWNRDTKAAAAIDLWVKETTVEEMSLFFYEVLHRMGDTYLRATNNKELAQLMHEFGEGFGERLGLRRRAARCTEDRG
jgi:gliding motility-associated protein GldC